jgi:hypothetical protein
MNEKKPEVKMAGISQKVLVSAYVLGSNRHQKYIESYGRLNRAIVHGIGKPASKDGTTKKK